MGFDVVSVRFAVVTWAPPGAEVLVIGNHDSLGSWKQVDAIPMQCSLGKDRFDSEPDYWWTEVQLPRAGLETIAYKFVQRAPGNNEWQWDDGENRKISIDCDHTTSSTMLLPVERFREGSGAESDYTGRFYGLVRDRRAISVRKVSNQLYLGSCPRQEAHIGYLQELGITAVMNFQADCDAMKNCVEGIGMEENPHAIAPLYEAANIEYVWCPTEDMSTAARAAMLPHASFVLAGLVRNGHKVFVHCNAGVGRSVAAVCGFLYYCVGLSPRQMQHVVAKARTVAYFDFKALESAKPHYTKLFGTPGDEWAAKKDEFLKGAGLFASM